VVKNNVYTAYITQEKGHGIPQRYRSQE